MHFFNPLYNRRNATLWNYYLKAMRPTLWGRLTYAQDPRGKPAKSQPQGAPPRLLQQSLHRLAPPTLASLSLSTSHGGPTMFADTRHRAHDFCRRCSAGMRHHIAQRQDALQPALAIDDWQTPDALRFHCLQRDNRVVVQ